MKTDEQILVKCEVHWFGWSGPLVGTILFLILAVAYVMVPEATGAVIACIVISLAFAVKALWNKYSHSLILTESRVIGKHGIIHVSKLVSPVWKVQGVIVDKSLLGRLFGYASIGIDTAGTGKIEYRYKYIKNADEFQQRFIQIQSEMRSASNQ
jgi:uncharacterized membrane protein YdbT with pleckstrin-like domain